MSYKLKIKNKRFLINNLKLKQPKVLPEIPSYDNITNIVIGMTISPRKEETYLQSILSVINAGFYPHLFVEPGVIIPEDFSFLNITYNETTLGCWKNWLTTAQQLYIMYPNADAYGIFQDDIILCKNINEYLTKCLFPSNAAVCSIFTPSHYSENQSVGWHKEDRGGTLWMAQTFIFSRFSFYSMLHSKIVNSWQGDKNIDNIVGRWARVSKLYPYYHVPSLCQHIGDFSTLWESNVGCQARGRKSASDFVGEDFNLKDSPLWNIW